MNCFVLWIAVIGEKASKYRDDRRYRDLTQATVRSCLIMSSQQDGTWAAVPTNLYHMTTPDPVEPELGLVIALILLVFVEVPVRVEIAIDVKSSEFEDRFAALQSPPGAGDFHAIFDQVTASAFDHPGGDRVPLGQVGRIVQIRHVIGQVGGTLINRLALFRAHALGDRAVT